MKKNILFFLLYTIMCFTSYSQNKQISYSSVNGLVTYDNGSGTKADIGAKLWPFKTILRERMVTVPL